MSNTLKFICVFCISAIPSWALAQKKEGVVLTNKVDAALTLHNVALLPSIDNVDGIFSRPIDKRLRELIDGDPQWEQVSSSFAGGLISPVDLIKNPDRAIKLAAPLKADGLLIAEVRKNPKDFVLALHLFSAKDGRLVSHVAAQDLDQSSIEKAMVQLDELYKQLKYRIPYDGLILSRTKNRVTLNLGQADGLAPGQELTCSKIIHVTRHPKLGHIIQNEKALIGKIRLIKVDKNLSFGDIVTETEEGAVQKDSKITGARVLVYKPENWINKDYVPAELLLSENNNVNGKLQEWRPELPPTFGQVGASIGLGPYQQTLSLNNGSSLSAKESFYPSVNLHGELWINPEWYVQARITQGTSSLNNPVNGGSPGDLSSSYSAYAMDVGYNLLLRDDFFDAKLFFALGFSTYKMSVDHSAPEGLTSNEYSAMRLTLGGKTPIDDAKLWYLGGTLYWYVNPSLKEKPVSSGSDDNRIVHFNFSLDYRWSERIWINSGLDFQTYMTDFSGGGTRLVPAVKGSHRFQTVQLGVSYMF